MTDHPLLGVARSFIDTLAKNNPLLFFYNFKTPPSLSRFGSIEPYLHQVDVLSRVICRRPVRLLVGDEIGLGKTVEALIVTRYLELRGEATRILILVPRTLVSHWLKDLLRTGVGIDRIQIITRDNFQQLEREGFLPRYYISSIDLVKEDRGPNLYRTVISKIEWDLVIVDEAHNLTRRAGRGTTLKTELVEDIVARHPSRHVIFLSATPHRGDPDDYLRRLALLDPRLVPSRNLDNRMFYELTHNTLIVRRTKEVVNEAERKQIFPKCNFNALAVQPSPAEEEFERLLSNFLRAKLGYVYERVRGKPTPLALLLIIIRKRASSSPYAALRTFERVLHGIELRKKYGPEYRRILEQEADHLAGTVFGIGFEDIEEMEGDFDDAVNDFAEKCGAILGTQDVSVIKRLVDLAREIADTGDTKLAAVLDLLEKHLLREEKVIVFTEYRDTLDYIITAGQFRKRFSEGSYRTLSGATSTKEFDAIVDQFVGDPNCKVLLATDVISEGRDLQASNVVINYEASWSLVKFEQRIGRVWRLGQRRDVEAYTVFKATPTELDVLNNLYAKLMAAESALQHARPLLGDRVFVAYRVTGKSSESMWRVGSPVALVEVGEREGKVLTEGDLVLASIRGNLTELVRELIAKLQAIKNEIVAKQVYPRARAEDIRNTVASSTGFQDVNEAYAALRRLAEETVNAMRGDPDVLHRYGSPRELVEYLQNALKDVPKPGSPAIFLDPQGDRMIYIGNAQLQLTSEPGVFLAAEPCVVSVADAREELRMGSSALEFLSEVMSKPLIAPTEMALEASLPQSVEARVESEIRSNLYPLLDSWRRYIEETTVRGWRNPSSLVGGDITIAVSLLAVIMAGSAEEVSSNQQIKNQVELEAMRFVIDYEKTEGRNPKDVHGIAHYDVESHNPKTAEVRHIEVKGHVGGRIYAELTEPEYETASRLRNSYWLYVVGDIGSGKPKLLCFRDPLSTLKIEEVRTVKIKEERRYVLKLWAAPY